MHTKIHKTVFTITPNEYMQLQLSNIRKIVELDMAYQAANLLIQTIEYFGRTLSVYNNEPIRKDKRGQTLHYIAYAASHISALNPYHGHANILASIRDSMSHKLYSPITLGEHCGDSFNKSSKQIDVRLLLKRCEQGLTELIETYNGIFTAPTLTVTRRVNQ